MARILTICPHMLLPVRGGGALRCYHLLRQLGRRHEVHAVIFQREAELRAGSMGYSVPMEIAVSSPLDDPPPRTIFQRLPGRYANALQYRWLRRSLRGPADSALLRSHHILAGLLRRHRFDAVVFEYMHSMNAAPLVRRLSPRTVRILDAHNVDHRLVEMELKARADGVITEQQQKRLGRLREIERTLGNSVDAVWACSDEDLHELAGASGIPGAVIANGVDCRHFAFEEPVAATDDPRLLFIGSLSTTANQDGCRHLLADIWPRLLERRPELRLMIVGRGAPEELVREIGSSPQVDLIGEVDDVRPWFRKASLLLVPLRVGSGTRLKILEAMSVGRPVVSTTRGAEGIEAEDGVHLLLADDPPTFVEATLRLLADRPLCEKVTRSARSLVERRYDWDVVGDAMDRSLEELLGGR